MTKSPTNDHKNINEAILAVMKEVGYVQKERKRGMNYTVKSESAVLQALRPAMLKHGIIMRSTDIVDVTHHTTSKGWARIVATHQFVFTHVPSDTQALVSALGEGADNGDKAANKSMTVAKKYALLETFLIECGDDPDDTPSVDMVAKATSDVKAAKAKATKDVYTTKVMVDPAWTEPVTKRTWTSPQKDAVIEAGAASNRDTAGELLDRSVVATLDSAAVVSSWASKYVAAYARNGDNPDAGFAAANSALTMYKETK